MPVTRTATAGSCCSPTTTRSGENGRPSHQPPTGWGANVKARRARTITDNNTEPRDGDGSTRTSEQKRLPAAEERGKPFRFAATAPLVARNPMTHEHHFFFLPVAPVEGKTIITYARTHARTFAVHTKLEDRWNLINDSAPTTTHNSVLSCTRGGSTRLVTGRHS